jgi:hypothetical protein
VTKLTYTGRHAVATCYDCDESFGGTWEQCEEWCESHHRDTGHITLDEQRDRS